MIIVFVFIAASLALALCASLLDSYTRDLEQTAQRFRREYAELSIQMMEDEVSRILGRSPAIPCQKPKACSYPVHNLDPQV